MRKLSVFILLSLTLVCAHAETLILHTGTRVKGTVVFQNEEVVILRNDEGARFQYPRTDIREILPDDAASEENPQPETDTPQEIKTSKKASILLELSGGVAVCPGETTGGALSADLLVGSHHIGDKHIFVGGGLGYHGIFLSSGKYNFLPIQAALRMPLSETKHAPVFGISVGYGVALSKNYLGGLYAGADFGYRCQVNPKTAISVVAFAQFQQARLTVTETLEGQTTEGATLSASFENQVGRSLVNAGLKLALYF